MLYCQPQAKIKCNTNSIIIGEDNYDLLQKNYSEDKLVKDFSKSCWNICLELIKKALKSLNFHSFKKYSKDHFFAVEVIVKAKLNELHPKERIAYLNAVSLNYESLFDFSGIDFILGITIGLISYFYSNNVFSLVIISIVVAAIILIRIFFGESRKKVFYDKVIEEIKKELDYDKLIIADKRHSIRTKNVNIKVKINESNNKSFICSRYWFSK